MQAHTRHLIVVSLAALVASAGCNKLKDHAGGGVPTAPTVPSVPGGASGEVDPNTCGNYAASDAGARLKFFLQSTKDLETATTEAAKIVKQSCIMMGQKLSMSDADLGGDDTKAICDKVIDTYKANLKVSLKAQGGIKIAFTPGQCTVDASAQASAAAGCEGHAGTGGNGGSCAAGAQASASVHAQCTPPSFDVTIVKPKLVLDTSKLQMTIDAMKSGLPELFSVAARIKPIQDALAGWVQAAKDLAAMGPKAAQSFGDQATCILGQLGAVANASTHIQANVSVSVSVSASASGSVGGN